MAARNLIGAEAVLEDVDAIEVLNARCLFNRRALALCREGEKPMVAGSDAYFYREVGRARTEYPSEPKSSLLEGRTAVGGGISCPAYLALTKGVKIWRRLTSGSI